MFNKANNHLKFGAIYATNYLKANQLIEEYDIELKKQTVVTPPKEEPPKAPVEKPEETPKEEEQK
jgi:hypothetical protein